MENLNDILSIDEIEELEHEGKITFKLFSEDQPSKIELQQHKLIPRDRSETVKDVKAYAEKHNGVIYTQVDSETSDDRIYNKGVHLVNRTGTWAVVTEPKPLAWPILQMFKNYIEQMLPPDGGSPMEDGEVERQLRLFDRFLTELEKTYDDCSYCEHKIAPNENFIGDEEKRCEECRTV